MTFFEPDGVYNSIPYRVLPDCSIEAIIEDGLVKFTNMEEFVALSKGSATGNRERANVNRPNANVPTHAGAIDYYSILMQSINAAQQNSAYLRALVYEKARFNLKRDILFGHTLLSLTDVARQVEEFELAVARVEAAALDQPQVNSDPNYLPENLEAKANHSIQILPRNHHPRFTAG